jgi:phage tail-like protein
VYKDTSNKKGDKFMGNAKRYDPYANCRFLLEISGIVKAGFTECSGLGSHIDPFEYREGGEHFTRKLIGRVTYPDIVLKWGLTDDTEMYDWHYSIVKGTINKKNGSIIVLDEAWNTQVRWNFFGAWPTKWDGPTFNATGKEAAIESLTLCCERIERA